ncbi:hypothetical protein [Viridibacterium curvum]|uniref:Lipoprotein n=1 Tax=Viridibacterium curvum TaxID=1101404 RepID=A0ABP9QQ30_9RHOO
MRFLYVIYATLVSVIVTSCNYGAVSSSSGNYRSWNSGGSSYSGGGFSGGHK